VIASNAAVARFLKVGFSILRREEFAGLGLVFIGFAELMVVPPDVPAAERY
jgi:hypothetical protein